MCRRLKATSNARAKSKSLAGQGSGQGKNPIPAQPRKLRDKKKEKTAAVKDSPTTHFKNEKVVADPMAQLQLEEKNTIPACFKKDTILKFPTKRLIFEPCIVSELPSSCLICTNFGHEADQCPWRRQLPPLPGVTQVGKGYGVDGRRAFRLWCAFCKVTGLHEIFECPERNKQIRRTGSGKVFNILEFKETS